MPKNNILLHFLRLDQDWSVCVWVCLVPLLTTSLNYLFFMQVFSILTFDKIVLHLRARLLSFHIPSYPPYIPSQIRMRMERVWVCVAVVVLAPGLLGDRWDQLNLHPEHLPFILANDPDLAEECRASHTCPFKVRPGRW